MMKQIFTLLLLGACLCTTGWAQNLQGVVKKATTKPKIDGVIDAVWDIATKYNVAAPVQTPGEGLPTLGAVGTTYFKALWDADGMFILAVVNDDQWLVADPYNKNDNIELYFDTNYVLADGLGGTDASTGNRRIMVTPPIPVTEDETTGFLKQLDVRGGMVSWAFKVPNKAAYTAEFFVPWVSIPDKAGILFDRSTVLGFDITIIDRDPGDVTRRRADWSNANLAGLGANGDNYHNMDAAGRLTLEGGTNVVINNVNITPGKITTDNGTLKPTFVLVPADATNSILIWSIVPGGTGRASINSSTGELKAILNGTVIIKAVTIDGGFAESDPTEFTISGQKITVDDINLIQNANFEQTDPAAGSVVGYRYWTTADATKRTVNSDGWLVAKCATGTNTTIYANIFGMGNLKPVDAITPYTVRFKAFASTPLVVPMLLEDRNNSNDAKETSLSTWRDATNNRWNVPIGTEPKWYKFDVTFSNWKANSAFELNYQVGLLDGTLYLDSVQLYSDADMKLDAKQLSKVSSLNVYPNPVGNAGEITVLLGEAKGSVAIYNSIGQKMMEKVATSTTVKFNVSSLRKGMYIVKLSDGTTQKFVR